MNNSNCEETRRQVARPRRRRVAASILLLLAAAVCQPRYSSGFILNNERATRTLRPFLVDTRLYTSQNNNGNGKNNENNNSESPSSSTKSSQKKHGANGKRTQLRWVVQSIENQDQVSKQLLEALSALLSAKTQKEVSLAGRQLEQLDLVQESREIQERVCKATALAGIFHISITLLQTMLQESYMPSHVAYNAVCSSLRRAGRTEQLKGLLTDLAEVARQKQELVHVYAFNMYLASLVQKVESPNDTRLEAARKWLEPGIAQEVFCVEPDIATFNTVLNAAARTGNKNLVDRIWKDLLVQQQPHQPNLQPDIWTYNSRLQVTSLPDRLALFDDELLQNNKHNILPDRYTIDLVILSLVRAGRVGDVEQLLDTFIATHPVKVVTHAFSAFMITLVQKGEIASARALFDTYVLPSFSSNTINNDDDSKNVVNNSNTVIQPDVRHFNVLIDGYRRQAELCNKRQGLDSADDDDKNQESHAFGKTNIDIRNDESEEAVRREGVKLFQFMKESGIAPDAYTLSSMMGICSTSEELSDLIVTTTQFAIPPAALRAAITSYGRLGDPASACVMFDKFASGSMNASVWNVLLGALAKGASWNNHNLRLDVSSCSAASMLDDSENDNDGQEDPPQNIRLTDFTDGMTCTEAVHVILDIMRQPPTGIVVPRPNSQSYCIAASALQHGPTDAQLAINLFRNATNERIPADGRFVNAIFRCFGSDLDAALAAWKKELRPACLAHEARTRSAPPSIQRTQVKNLIAAYHGLLYVCGRALRPDIALRVAYAMVKEGIEPNDVSLNCYHAGKRTRERLAEDNTTQEDTTDRPKRKLLPKFTLDFVDQYENLFFIECTKYDQNDMRRSKDRRVRIIV
jgi:hypothetical protein